MNRFPSLIIALIKTLISFVILAIGLTFLFYQNSHDNWWSLGSGVGWGIIVSFGLWMYFTSQEYNTAIGNLSGWQRAPINHYNIELFIPTDNPTQLKRDKVKLEDDEWDYLKDNAEKIIALSWRYTTRDFEDYNYWRRRFLFWGWAVIDNPDQSNSPISFTRAGKVWLEYIANYPSPRLDLSNLAPK